MNIDPVTFVRPDLRQARFHLVMRHMFFDLARDPIFSVKQQYNFLVESSKHFTLGFDAAPNEAIARELDNALSPMLNLPTYGPYLP